MLIWLDSFQLLIDAETTEEDYREEIKTEGVECSE